MSSSPHKENEVALLKRRKSKERELSGERDERKRKKSTPRGQSKSCHQCRQSIFSEKGVGEAKQGQLRVKCSSCTRFWCEKCLHNRYGVVLATVDPISWSCPFCLKNCNCSICRRKEGKLATGILTPLAKNAGFTSVSQFLNESSDEVAKCLQWRSPVLATPITRPIKRKRMNSDTGLKLQESAVALKEKRRRRSSSSSDSNKMADRCDAHEKTCCLSPEQSCTCRSDKEHSPTRGQSLEHSRYSITLEHSEPGNVTHTAESSFKVDEDAFVCRNLRGRTVMVPLNKHQHQSCDTSAQVSKTRIAQVRRQRTAFQRRGSRKRAVVQSVVESNGLSLLRESSSESAVIVKKEQLLHLKKKRANSLKKKKADIKQSLRCQKVKERKILRERKVKEKVELRLFAREKLRKARALLKEAQRTKRLMEKEEEKKRRKAELEKILKKRREERRRRKLMTSLNAVVGSRHRDGCLSDTVQVISSCGNTTVFPVFPQLDVGVADEFIPTFLCVCEFLHTFSTPLKLKKTVTRDSLAALLENEKGMSDICWSLLKALATEHEDLNLDMKGLKREKNVKEIVHRHLKRTYKNGVTNHMLSHDALRILDQLCHQLLETSLVTEYIDSAMREEEEVKRKLRLQEQEKCREMREILKLMCEEKCTTEALEEKRNGFVKDLQDMRVNFEQELRRFQSCQRVTPICRDQCDSLYWILQSVDGVILERRVEEGGQLWEVISSDEDIKSVMDSASRLASSSYMKLTNTPE